MRMLDEYVKLHRSTYGRGSEGRLDRLVALTRDAQAASVLDFGCGQSTAALSLGRRLGVTALRYDPAIPEHSVLPDAAVDLVMNTDVLEHIPEDEVPDFLATMRRFSPKAYIKISMRPANTLLSNGDNAHCTLKSKAWWAAALSAHYDTVQDAPSGAPDSVEFVTWPLSDQAAARLRRLGGARQRNEALRRLRRRFVNRLNLLRRPPLSETALLQRVAGKSVALVGNAVSLSDQAYGDAIDAHDIVVRFNRMPIMSARSHGRKTDWTVGGAAFAGKSLAKARKVSLAIGLATELAHAPTWVSAGRIPAHIVGRARLRTLRDQLGAEPSLGVVALSILAGGSVARLSLYGFDFMQSGTLSAYAGPVRAQHNFDAEAQFVAALVDQVPAVVRYV